MPNIGPSHWKTYLTTSAIPALTGRTVSNCIIHDERGGCVEMLV